MKNIILVICTGYFGDVLLTSKLTRDIQQCFENDKVVYICDTPYVTVAKNLPGVDDVYAYDRRQNSNPFKYLNFILKFPYRKNVKYAFVIHQNKKSRVALAKHLGAKKVYAWEDFKADSRYEESLKIDSKYENIAYFNANMLSLLTNKFSDDKDVEFFIPKESQNKIDEFLANTGKKDFIAINPQAGDEEKCWDVKEFIKFVKILISRGQTPVITGVSKDGTKYVEELESGSQIKSSDYINLIDKTNVVELGALYNRCNYVVSVDTGSAHMSSAVGAKTLVLFFRNDAHLWSPINVKNNSHISGNNISAQEVINEVDRKFININ